MPTRLQNALLPPPTHVMLDVIVLVVVDDAVIVFDNEGERDTGLRVGLVDSDPESEAVGDRVALGEAM